MGCPCAIIPGEREIEAARDDPFDQFDIARDARLDAHFGMGPREPSKHVGQERLAEILLQAQPHPALERHAMDCRGGLVIKFKQTARISEHGLARFGQSEAAPRLAEDRRRCLVLELFELGAHRRSGAAEPVGGLGETAKVDAGGEAAQHIEVESDLSHENRPFNWDC
jgi:hypothetical protein